MIPVCDPAQVPSGADLCSSGACGVASQAVAAIASAARRRRFEGGFCLLCNWCAVAVASKKALATWLMIFGRPPFIHAARRRHWLCSLCRAASLQPRTSAATFQLRRQTNWSSDAKKQNKHTNCSQHNSIADNTKTLIYKHSRIRAAAARRAGRSML